MGNILENVTERDLHYSRQRQRNRVFTAVVSFFAEKAEEQGISKKDVASALKRDPSQITRWLAQPSNLTLDTISDILLALDAEMDVRIVKFRDRHLANYMHPLAAQIKNIKTRQQFTASVPTSGSDITLARVSNKSTSTLEVAQVEFENA